MQFKSLVQSRTFWINLISVAYVLITGNVSALQSLHLNDHTEAALIGVINILNRILFTDSRISGFIK